MLGGVLMVVSLTVFIIVHEAGHYLTARATGMKATEFFVGFGPRLWSFRRGETEYGIKAFPLGGYVRIAGMDYREEIDPADAARAYRDQAFWRKSVVVLSGVTLNLITAFLLLTAMFMISGDPAYTNSIARVGSTPEGVLSPAAEAGLREGDRITALDGVPVEDWWQTAALISSWPGRTIVIDYIRDGQARSQSVTLASRESPEGGEVGFLGISPQPRRVSISPLAAAGRAAQLEWEMATGTVASVGRILRPDSLLNLFGVLGGETEEPDEIRLVSPIGLVQIGVQFAQLERSALANLLALMAVVNITLAIFNSLPLYPLDGGHFAVAVYEKVTGRRANTRKLFPVAAAVIGLVFFLGLVAVILDIVNPLNLGL